MTTDTLKFTFGRDRTVKLNPFVVYAAIVGISLGIVTALTVLSLAN